MARGGVYKTEIEKARNALLAGGKHPSVDAVRVALGNTGSKTTIHRYLKELETEDSAGVGGKYPVSDALADLVSRLAGRLNEEADTKIAEAQSRFDAQLRERTGQLDQARQETAELRSQLERVEIALYEEKTTHETARQSLVEATTQIRQLEERITGLNARLTEHETHIQSLEKKHEHAHEALEHYRTSVKEHRDQEQRRHEHQIQEFQVSLRQANETIAAKNHELLQLNRDNARFTEHVGQTDNELRQIRGTLRDRDHELQALRPLANAHSALQERYVQIEKRAQDLTVELTDARSEMIREREARHRAENLAEQANSRSATIDEILTKVTAASGAVLQGSAGSASATPPK